MWPATQLRLRILLRKGENYIGLKQSLPHHCFVFVFVLNNVLFCNFL